MVDKTHWSRSCPISFCFLFLLFICSLSNSWLCTITQRGKVRGPNGGTLVLWGVVRWREPPAEMNHAVWLASGLLPWRSPTSLNRSRCYLKKKILVLISFIGRWLSSSNRSLHRSDWLMNQIFWHFTLFILYIILGRRSIKWWRSLQVPSRHAASILCAA